MKTETEEEQKEDLPSVLYMNIFLRPTAWWFPLNIEKFLHRKYIWKKKMIRAAYKSRELPYDSQDVTLVNEDSLQFQRRTRLFLQRWVLKEEHLPNLLG